MEKKLISKESYAALCDGLAHVLSGAPFNGSWEEAHKLDMDMFRIDPSGLPSIKAGGKSFTENKWNSATKYSLSDECCKINRQVNMSCDKAIKEIENCPLGRSTIAGGVWPIVTKELPQGLISIPWFGSKIFTDKDAAIGISGGMLIEGVKGKQSYTIYADFADRVDKFDEGEVSDAKAVVDNDLMSALDDVIAKIKDALDDLAQRLVEIGIAFAFKIAAERDDKVSGRLSSYARYEIAFEMARPRIA